MTSTGMPVRLFLAADVGLRRLGVVFAVGAHYPRACTTHTISQVLHLE